MQLFQKGAEMHKNICLQIAGLSVLSWLFDSMAPFKFLISMMIVQEKYLII